MKMKLIVPSGRRRWRSIRTISLQAFFNGSPRFWSGIDSRFANIQFPRPFRSIGFKFVWMLVPLSVASQVTPLVNADEMLLQLYPKETHLIAPTNVKRVGSNRAEDKKKDCTVMVACEMFQSQIIAPMVIMTGQPEGTLSRRFNSWDGPSKVTFHRKHWMDKEGCSTYLEWLRLCCPKEKIGLIWDAASSHFSDQVKKKAAELNITLAGIPPGCTSLIQICDLIAKKRSNKSSRNGTSLGILPLILVLVGNTKSIAKSWLEQAIEDVNDHMSSRSEVSKAFATYGQDFRRENCSGLSENLAKHKENVIYRSLISNQKSLNME